MTRSPQSKNPKRRIAPAKDFSDTDRELLLRSVRYVGSALHKSKPGDYGLRPPVSPRPHKSLCDALRPILRQEAEALFAEGIRLGLVSTVRQGPFPKYVWCVDDAGEVYEAKIGNAGYHGYRLDHVLEKAMRRIVLKEWEARQGLF